MERTTTNEGMSVGEFADELKPGTPLLHGQYVIEGFLNSGGFGMTYLAKDSLDRTVVIKECFPASFCCRNDTVVRARSRSQQKEFKSVVRLFGQEARRLSKLDHPNIVGVHQVFEDNETAYMALDYVDGQDMLDIVEEDKRKLGPAEIQKILMQILDAIRFIHDENILHRDISPDNILLDNSGTPVLIDFGAAREKATKASRALSALLVVKDGYSPQEFYIAGSVQTPSSDLYALAATFYHLIVGEAPPNSQKRLAAVAADEPDPFQPLQMRASGYDADFVAAIDKTLSVFPKDRIQTANDWMLAIDADKRTEAALEKAQSDESTTLAISKLVIEANQAAMDEAPEQAAPQPPNITVPEAVRNQSRDRIIAKLGVTVPAETKQLQTGGAAGPKANEKIAEDLSAPGKPPLKNSARKRSLRRFWFFGKSRTDNFGRADQ